MTRHEFEGPLKDMDLSISTMGLVRLAFVLCKDLLYTQASVIYGKSNVFDGYKCSILLDIVYT